MSDTRFVKAGTTDAEMRKVYFDLITDATDYVTPETGEAGGQPQISTNGGAWTSTGIGTLTSTGNGSYYATLTAGAVDTSFRVIKTRYKSSNTSEARGSSIIVTAKDPFNETQTVSLGTSTIGTAQIADGAFTAAKFAANAITSTIVADGTITAAKIGSDAITNAKIADDAIAVENIASAALSDTKFAAASLTAAKFASDLNVFSGVARLVQTGASSQQVTVFISRNNVPLDFSQFAEDPGITITTTGGTIKLDDALSAFGSYGMYASLSGASLLASGDAAEARIAFIIGSTSYELSIPIEKQYA